MVNEEKITSNCNTSIDTAQCGSQKIVALYKFVTPKIPADKLSTIQTELEKILRSVQARGTILLACEGINGTVCYPLQDADKDDGKDVDKFLAYFQTHMYFSRLRIRVSFANTPVFHRLKVKLKKEIVTMLGNNEDDDQPSFTDKDLNLDACSSTDQENKCRDLKKKENALVDPTKIVGTYIKAGKEWDDLLMDPDVAVIDTRNKYEVEVGTFENAISPNTDNFKQFPGWLKQFAEAACCEEGTCNIDSIAAIDTSSRNEQQSSRGDEKKSTLINCDARSTESVPFTIPGPIKKPKAVAMFCTGGIRCEKATSYTLAAKIFPPDVAIYHLDGGILAYLAKHPDAETSKWKGECFVFDQRVSVTHGLKPSDTYNLCHACRRPVSIEDKNGEDYIQGVCCKLCNDSLTDPQKQRFKERQRQMDLAAKRGSLHIHDPKEIEQNMRHAHTKVNI